MNFSQAIDLLGEGKKIKRQSDETTFYIYSKFMGLDFFSREKAYTIFRVNTLNAELQEYRFTAKDIFANDWIEVITEN